MQIIENHWITKDVGLNEVGVLRQEKATEEAKAVIAATVDAHFAGKLKPIGPFDADGNPKIFGTNIAFGGKARIRIAYKDPDNPKLIKYRFEEKPATKAHIMAAVLCTRTEDGSLTTPDGEDVKPWVHLVFEDGSQLDLEAVAVKAKAPTPKPPTGVPK